MSLQILEGSELNKVSDKVKSYLSENKLSRGKIAKFRLLTGKVNTDKDKHGDPILLNSVITIPLTSYINDPENGSVQVGVIKSVNPITKLPVFEKYHIYPKRGKPEFELRGSMVNDIRIYDAILLSNSNKSNPFRDQYEPEIFEMVDEAKESKVRSTKRNYLFDSLATIRRWNTGEMRTIGAYYNLSTSLDPDVLKDKLEEIAEKDPKKFYDTIESDDVLIGALIKMAQEAGIIGFSAHENKWYYAGSNETIVLLDRKEGINEHEQFCYFLKNSTNGTAIRGNLEKLLKKK